MATVIDAHQHFWNPTRVNYPWLGADTPAINRTFDFADLEPILSRHGIQATVLVQSADRAEDTAAMLEMARAHSEIVAVVAYVPLERPREAALRLSDLRRNDVVVGVRNLIHNQPDPDWLLRPEVDAGLGVLASAGVSFDLVSVLPRHLEHAVTIAERHPDLRIVIDHLSKPPIKDGGDWSPWRELITAAARCPNVSAKLSGLYPVSGRPDDWTAHDIEPFVHFALELFGAPRLMYGGDWPISVLNGGYDKVWREMSVVLAALSVGERDAVLGGTATEFYRIPASRIAALR